MFDHNNMEATLAVSCGRPTDNFKGVAGLLTLGSDLCKAGTDKQSLTAQHFSDYQRTYILKDFPPTLKFLVLFRYSILLRGFPQSSLCEGSQFSG